VAVQPLGDVHDTPPRKPSRPPLGTGVCRIVHVRPFHDSANVPEAKVPTALHAVAEVHDTPVNCTSALPAGLGVRRILQLRPFQCSASVRWTPAGPAQNPVAVHAVADVQDTLIRKLLAAPRGLGVGCTVQLVPFQRSARVTIAPPRSSSPTAVQALPVVHDTPFRLLTAGRGVLRIVQLMPFQDAANVPKVLPLPSKSPTAAHACWAEHDTALRLLAIAPAGTGGDWACQLGTCRQAAFAGSAAISAPDATMIPTSAIRASAGSLISVVFVPVMRARSLSEMIILSEGIADARFLP
jgi:hypothetical protein